eukprot:4610911-Pleurochrysis_carterae.AAC.4
MAHMSDKKEMLNARRHAWSTEKGGGIIRGANYKLRCLEMWKQKTATSTDGRNSQKIATWGPRSLNALA